MGARLPRPQQYWPRSPGPSDTGYLQPRTLLYLVVVGRVGKGQGKDTELMSCLVNPRKTLNQLHLHAQVTGSSRHVPGRTLTVVFPPHHAAAQARGSRLPHTGAKALIYLFEHVFTDAGILERRGSILAPAGNE